MRYQPQKNQITTLTYCSRSIRMMRFEDKKMESVNFYLKPIQAAQLNAAVVNLSPKIQQHWSSEIESVTMRSEFEYLTVARHGIDFERFEKVLSTYIPYIAGIEWPVKFMVYDAFFTAEFLFRIN